MLCSVGICTTGDVLYTLCIQQTVLLCNCEKECIHFLDYDYDTNAIFALPTKDLKDSTLIQAFDQVFTELEEEGHKHKFNVTNDQATKPIEEFPKTKDCK